MGKLLYLECNSGISGDMTVGALLDLGADQKVLEHALASLSVEGYHLHFGRKTVCGLDAFDFDVHLEAHDHGHAHGHDHGHSHSHHHHHEHRNLSDVYEVIDRLDSNDRVKELARNMFYIVAQAEGKAHGLPIEEVHFHEVGAIDSIVDIISVAVCIDNLGIEEVVVSPLAEGHGHVHCQHGILPVPVPATANIVSAYGLPVRLTDNEGEMVTPTGAAIAAALRTKEELPSACRLLKVGMGAGNKEFKQANVLRAMLMETEAERETGLWVMETNLDDCTGEALGFVMDTLLEKGALDVWYTPAFMKKNRPAYLLSVLYQEADLDELEEIILNHTTTIGIRRYPVDRTVLTREKQTVMTPHGEAEVKVCRYKNRIFYYPEYESVKQICTRTGIDFQSVYCDIREAAKQKG